MKNKDQDIESIYELSHGNEGNVTEPTSSETNSYTEESNPNLHEDREKNSQENNQVNEIEVTDNRTPIFIPDEASIRIKRSGPVKNLETKRRDKKR